MVSAVILVLLLFYFELGSEYYLRLFGELLDFPAWIGQLTFEQALGAMGMKAVILSLALLGPPVGISLVAGIFVNFVQIGALFAPKAAKPDAKRINPLSSLKKHLFQEESCRVDQVDCQDCSSEWSGDLCALERDA